MADTLTTITEFIIKPSTPFAAGVVLFGVVWGFFKGVESVLTDDTKLEMAIWFVGVEVTPRWQSVLNSYVRAVCGSSALSWRCIGVASTVGTAAFLLAFGTMTERYQRIQSQEATSRLSDLVFINIFLWMICFFSAFLGLLLVDYEVRRSRLGLWELFQILLMHTMFFYFLLLVMFVWVPVVDASDSLKGLEAIEREVVLMKLRWLAFPKADTFLALLISTSWFWLYGAAALILKLMHRFDIGFQWFNRKFDIEKKPLSSIGLVAGALVAVCYWAAVIVSRVA